MSFSAYKGGRVCGHPFTELMGMKPRQVVYGHVPEILAYCFREISVTPFRCNGAEGFDFFPDPICCQRLDGIIEA